MVLFEEDGGGFQERRSKEVLKQCLQRYEQAVHPKWEYRISDSGRCTCSADIDGDNYEELIIGTQDNHIYALSHQGRLQWKYSAGGEIYDTYVRDIDNDGSKEVIAACWDAHVYVLDSEGNLEWKFRTNDEVWAVYAADIDNDMHIEVIAGCWDGQIYIIDCNGKKLKQTLETGDEVKSVFARDIDSDGQIEILAGCHDGRVVVLDNTGQLRWTFEANDAIRSVLCADIDHDHFEEMLVSSRDRSIYVLDHKGAVLQEYGTGGSVVSVCCADLSGDGDVEIIAGCKDNHIYVWDRNGTLQWKHEVKGAIWYVHASDIDSDGFAEIIVSTREGTVLVLPTKGVLGLIRHVRRLYKEVGEEINALGLTARQVRTLGALVNLQEGRKFRAVVPIQMQKAVHACDHGKYLQALDMFLALRHFPFEVTMTYQTKGAIRRVYCTYENGAAKVIFGGHDNFVYVLDEGGVRWRYGTGGWVFGVFSSDIDNDGQEEVIAGSRDGHVYVLDDNGQLKWKYNVGDFVWSVYCADIDIDGTIEVLAGGRDTLVYVLDPKGDLKTTVKTGDKIWCISAADLDGEGYKEIITGCWDGCVYVWNSMDGRMLWKFDMIEDEVYSVWGIPVCAVKSDREGSVRIVVGSKDGYVYALDCHGRLKWKQRIGNVVRSVTSVVSDGDSCEDLLLIGSEDEYLYLLDQEGTLLQKYCLGSWVNSVYAVNRGMRCELAVGLGNGSVNVYRFVDKQAISSYILKCYTALKGTDELGLLTEFSRHESAYIRGYAAEKAVPLSLENSKAVKLFEEITKDTDAYVRSACAVALSKLVGLDSAKFSKLLQRFVNDSDPQVRLAVVSRLKDVVKTWPSEAFEAAKKLAKDENDQVRRTMVRMLGKLSAAYPDQTYPILLTATHDREDWIRHETARSLADYFDAHPDRLFTSAKALFTHECPLEIVGYVSTLARNEAIREALQAYRNLLENTDEGNVGKRLEEATASFENFVEWAEHSKEVHGLYKWLQGLFTFRSIEEMVTAWPVDERLPRREDALYPQVIDTLAGLGRIVDLLTKYLEREALGDRLAYLLDAIEAIEDLQRDVAQRFLVAEASKYTYPEKVPFDLLLSRWRGMVRTDLAKLRGRAELQSELKTKHSPFEERVTLVLEVRNIGKSPAENVRVQLMGEDGYTIIGKDYRIVEYISSQGAVTMEFTIRPTAMAHRITFELTYDDAGGQDKTFTFADRVEFFKVSREFVPIINPYVVGLPIKSSRLFFGRQDVLDFLKLNLSGHGNVDNIIVLHGQRRSGKSSILYQLLNTSILAPHVPVLIDMQGLMDVDTPAFFYRLAREISQTLKRRSLKVVRPQLNDFVHHPTIVFDDFLDEIEDELGERKIVLMFDEFELLEEKVKEGKISQDIFGYLRSLMQHRRQLNFIFTGTHTLQLLSRDYWSVFFNIALHRKISFLEEKAATTLITRPVAGQLEYDPLAVEKIRQLTADHPYFIQLICHSLINFCNQTKRNYATITDVNIVLNEVMETGQDHFQFIWIKSTVQERLALAAIAQIGSEEGRSVSLADLDRTYREHNLDFDEKVMRETARNLVERDILEKTSEQTRFRITIGLIQRWLWEVQPLEQVVRDEFRKS